MKQNYRKFLIAAAIPVIVASVPGVTFADCSDNPPTSSSAPSWDSGVRVPKTATVGNGTVITAPATIGGYAKIDVCANIGDGSGTVRIGSSARVGYLTIIDGATTVGGSANVGNGVTINGSSLASSARIGDGSTISGGAYIGGSANVGQGVIIDGSSLGTSAVIGDDSTISGDSSIASSVHIAGGATITGSSLGGHSWLGSGDTLSGAKLGYQVTLGDYVKVDSGAQIGGYTRVDSGVDADHPLEIGANAYIGSSAHICMSVAPGMHIVSNDSYGCN
jgi:UDP-3-O-[3-hydroxymyristoyl] glucosamine N-acyltransferase